MSDDSLDGAAIMSVLGFFLVFIGVWIVSNFGTAMVAGGAIILTSVIMSLMRST